MILELIMIVIHATQTTLRGSAFKHVHCEGCGEDYVYELERKITAANNQARKVLKRALERAFDVVPCPACGHYQEHMLKKAKKKHAYWMNVVGLVLVIPSPVLLLGALMASAPPGDPGVAIALLIWAGIFLLLGVGLLIAKSIRSRHFDPNAADQEKRIRLGRYRAHLRSDLEEMLRERERFGN
jgi:ribosomal protein S27E